MKFLSLLVFLFLLASCGGNQAESIKDMSHDTTKIIATDDVDVVVNEEAPLNEIPEDTLSDEGSTVVYEEAPLNELPEDVLTDEESTVVNEEAPVNDEEADYNLVAEDSEEDTTDYNLVAEDSEEAAAEEAQLEADLLEVTEEIDTETGNEIKTIETTYTNPNGEVNMTINFQLDSEGNIGDISVVADNYDLSEFNDYTQSLIGGTLEEATEAYLSGSSLATAAFQDAMKAELK